MSITVTVTLNPLPVVFARVITKLLDERIENTDAELPPVILYENASLLFTSVADRTPTTEFADELGGV